MDPLAIYWKTSCQIPNLPGKISWHLKGYSRAAYRTGFYIPELNLMSDAGPQLRNRPDNIFITHTHGDHVAQLPFTLIVEGKQPVHIYAPKETEEYLRQYISALFTVNACKPMRNEIEKQYEFHGVEPYTQFPVTLRNNPYLVEVFACEHPVPTVSYGLSMVKQKLKEEYLGLSGPDLVKLRKNGLILTHEVYHKVLAYVCDTTIRVFRLNRSLLSYPTIIIECTFLREEDVNGSEHICWTELEPIIVANPETFFILIHFSMKYTAEELTSFFTAKKWLKNMKAWLDE